MKRVKKDWPDCRYNHYVACEDPEHCKGVGCGWSPVGNAHRREMRRQKKEVVS